MELEWTVENVYWYKAPVFWPNGAYYIGRGGNGLERSIFANPFTYEWMESKDPNVIKVKDPIRAFRKQVWLAIQEEGPMFHELRQLMQRSGVFMCFCKRKELIGLPTQKPCHGDVLVNAIKYLRTIYSE